MQSWVIVLDNLACFFKDRGSASFVPFLRIAESRSNYPAVTRRGSTSQTTDHHVRDNWSALGQTTFEAAPVAMACSNPCDISRYRTTRYNRSHSPPKRNGLGQPFTVMARLHRKLTVLRRVFLSNQRLASGFKQRPVAGRLRSCTD
jgi:hypothetical protein